MRKKKGNVSLIVLGTLALLVGVSGYLLTYSQINKSTVNLQYTKSQSKQAADYGLKKYIEIDKAKNINAIDLPKNGILGETSQYLTTWELTENNVEIENIYGGSGVGSGKVQLYRLFPLGKNIWEKTGEMDSISSKNALSGDYNDNLNYPSYKVSSIDFKNVQIVENELIKDTTFATTSYLLNNTKAEFFKGLNIFDKNINYMENIYVIGNNDTASNSTNVKIYRTSSSLGDKVELLYEGNLAFITDLLDLTGVYSPSSMGGEIYITFKTRDSKIITYQYSEEKNKFAVYDTIKDVQALNISTTCIWNLSLNVSEYYLSYMDSNSSYQMFKIVNSKREVVPYANSIPTAEGVSNYSIAGLYDTNVKCSFIYLVEQTSSEGNKVTSYRYTSNASVWDYIGEQSLDYIGEIDLIGVPGNIPSFILMNDGKPQEYVRSCNVTSVGKVFKKKLGVNSLVSQSIIKGQIDIEYKEEEGSLFINSINVHDVIVK